MAVLQEAGRIALARAVAAQPIYLAWGRGRPEWDAQGIEPEPTNAGGLVDEIGRRMHTSIGYVLPAQDGEIELPDRSRYTTSATPTKWLHVRWTFDFTDAAGETVRELGVFLGGTQVPGLPAGQRYFTAAQVATPGDLYTLERHEPFKRAGGTRQAQEFVLPF
ncbi:hypothetical protein AVMA1855_03715 [Acidovorax sp. SUPP1855]|uniref:hypothetical protein n=1 Tax=Acidovorax sp. SUPP1855 TaxID=431774 RepID=UPI0023DE4372|nr:hypothetical protein [Acidovorax sp. SUPP1855]GKS83217.1 hypothetical protein AVMA1855_03715 [Acidovorax sp. SUPP1855]